MALAKGRNTVLLLLSSKVTAKNQLKLISSTSKLIKRQNKLERLSLHRLKLYNVTPKGVSLR